MKWQASGQPPPLDPYLAWAEATHWRDFKHAHEVEPEWLTVVVELHPGQSPKTLQAALGRDIDIARAYLETDTLFCTARVRRTAWHYLDAAERCVVRRFELALPVLAQRTAPRRPVAQAAAPRARAPGRQTSSGAVLLAVIDAGCPFAHTGFQHRGRPRVLNLWDQDRRAPAFGTATAPGAVPGDFGYGREVNRQELSALMQAARGPGGVDEDACYELAAYRELRPSATHGAHVMDHFTGPRRLGDRIALAPGQPPTRRRGGARASDHADLVFVQLPRDAWADPNGLALPACVLDGLRYILSCRTKATRRVVVNLSCAIYTGAHNGSSLLDRALDALVTEVKQEDGCDLELVMPAGNAHAAQWHAAGTLGQGSLTLRVPPGSESPAFMQVWVQAPVSKLSVKIKAPYQDEAADLKEPLLLLRDGGAVRAMLAATQSPARGDVGGTLFLLAVAAAELPDQAGPAGDWTLELSFFDKANPAAPPVQAHAYVARNESTLGAPLRHRPARLIDPHYDPDRYLREREEDPQLPVADEHGLRVRRAGTAADAAFGTTPFIVGGVVLGPRPKPAPYSGSGLDAKACAAVTDESRALAGIAGAGTRSASVVRLQGTSFGTPQLARVLADRSLLPPAAGAPGERGGLPGTPLTEFLALPFSDRSRAGAVLALPQQSPPVAPATAPATLLVSSRPAARPP